LLLTLREGAFFLKGDAYKVCASKREVEQTIATNKINPFLNTCMSLNHPGGMIFQVFFKESKTSGFSGGYKILSPINELFLW
jgi:hypothetical protein